MKKLYLMSAAIIASIPAVFATADIEPIVVVKTTNGPVRISKSQFNPDQHEIHTGDEYHDADGVAIGNNRAPIAQATAPIAPETQATVATPPAPIAPGADGKPRQFGVLANKGKFFIVSQTDGATVTDVPGFDPKGYANNQDAWKAITAVMAPAAAPDNAAPSV